MELGGKTAIVTGAGRGIGRDISLRLAKEGCNLVLVSRTGKQLEKVKEEIECINSKAIIFPGDISEKGSISKIIEETMEHFNSIDILINNAAVLFPSDFMEITEEEWDKTMNINLKSAFLLSQKIFCT
jgi:NAD(P)-dependent dehydrogenase (short-subunit alcohol dehydrogenase family)